LSEGGTASEIAISLDHPKEGILWILIQQPGKKCRAGGWIGPVYLGKLCQGKEELSDILDRVILISGGDTNQPQSILLGACCSQATLLDVRVHHQTQGRENGQEDEQQNADTQAGPRSTGHRQPFSGSQRPGSI
jgi:hypothetical protein